ncbi:MAG: recombinase family protein [Eubacteriales bacterium]
MPENRKITYIPANPKFIFNVVIYCRVSTKSEEQLGSLINQVSYLTRLVSGRLDWRLTDIYIDIKSGADTASRTEFQRMMDDSHNGKINIIVTKSISRFGRNTEVTLKAINELRIYGVDVFFENEEIHTKDRKNDFYISLLESMAQEESVNRSENISWGIKRQVEGGKSKILYRKCYGYYQDEQGNLKVQDDETAVVHQIFDLYLQGASIVAIVRELEKRGIKSPTGNDSWSKRTIETVLSNEKYTGNVIICKTYNVGYPDKKRIVNNDEKVKYIIKESNPLIISKEQFDKVQEEKIRRSNVIKNDSGIVRKKTHYSVKRDATSSENNIPKTE